MVGNFAKGVKSIRNRCITIYIIVALTLLYGVDHQRVIKKTLDFLQRIPPYLVEYALGEEEVNDKNFRHGVRYYRNLIKLYPDSATAYNALAFCYYHLGKKDMALQYYKKAASFDAGFFGVFYNLGLMHYQRQEWAEAVEAFREAVESSTHKTLIAGAVGPFGLRPDLDADNMQQNKKELRSGYQKAFELIVLGIHHMGDLSGARDAALVGIKKSPGDKRFFYYYVGKRAYEMKKYQEAMTYLNKSAKAGFAPYESYLYFSLSAEKSGFKALARQSRIKADKFPKEKQADVFSEIQKDQGFYFYPCPRIMIINGKRRKVVL